MMRALKFLVATAVLSVPNWAAIPAHPGMLNYVEGQANIDGRPVSNQSVGNADVGQGQVIETGQGKAEILLTPGVLLRLGDHSAVRMVNPGLTTTTVEVLRGEALVEATDVRPANHIQIIDHGVTTTLDKNGLYSFNADQPQVAVYEGKATLSEGDKHEDLKKGKDAELADLHVTKFDTKQGDDLYRWSDLRSEYLSEASVSSARAYLVAPLGWYGTGWYWNPWYGYYSFLPGAGYLYSPFGWGFYGPRTIVYYHGPYRTGAGFVAMNHAAIAPHAAFAGGGFRGGRR
jgi:FecR protein